MAAPRLDDGAIAALESRDWPGNVRELRNAAERALILARGASLSQADFPPAKPPLVAEGAIPFPATMREIGRAAAEAMLQHSGGNKSEAARRLGISRARLMRLLDAATTSDDNLLDEVSDA
jgi:DNA-binding NtrC family response regulator